MTDNVVSVPVANDWRTGRAMTGRSKAGAIEYSKAPLSACRTDFLVGHGAPEWTGAGFAPMPDVG